MQGHDTGIKEEERDGKDMRQETGWRKKLQGHGTVVREKGSFGKDMRQDREDTAGAEEEDCLSTVRQDSRF